MIADYRAFLQHKSQLGSESGFDPIWMPEFLFDFQGSLVEWAVRKGRAAIFADCGLGKTPMQLVWAENVVRRTNRPVLILTPLAVAAQTVREGEKFGIDCRQSRDGKNVQGITVANYERLHYFDAADFAGVVCDESSCLKDFDGVRSQAVTEFMRKMQFRLLCTATAAPNDFIELGTSSEALGELGNMDMLARFFKNDDKSLFLHGTKYGDMTQKNWKFKAHSEVHFWRWVCSWARACRKPSDLGFDDGRFKLPEMLAYEHEVTPRSLPDGCLFDMGATTLGEQRDEQRRTVQERCEKVAELASHSEPVVCWGFLNDECDLMERLVPGAGQVSGKDCDEKKEELFAAFSCGELRALVTKPKIGGFGLNWQHCAHQTFFPSHSFEQWYQAVRRSYRFGQPKAVRVDMVTTEGSYGVMESLNRKSAAAERMFSQLVEYMNQPNSISIAPYGEKRAEIPAWL